MPVVNTPININITIQSSEFLSSGELYALYLLAAEREEEAKQKSIELAVQRMKLAEKTAQLFGYECAARTAHLIK